MTDYAIGDIQGCYDPLVQLLDRVNFDPAGDTLWVTGDIVNRGPASLACLRLIHSLGDGAITVLGNHDLHLLAVAAGVQKMKRKDTLEDILEAPDRDALLAWLRSRALLHYDARLDMVMTHAGIPPQWTLKQARGLAAEVETVLRGKRCREFLDQMYGDAPDRWRKSLKGHARLRIIVNYFTRMRFLDPKGTLDLVAKEGVDKAPKGFQPWFQYPPAVKAEIVFGHWAALQAETGVARIHSLDSGCVWGGCLTLMNLQTREKLQCECA